MSCGPEPEQNMERAIAHVREAAKQGAELVCLPELFQTQYFCQREDTALLNLLSRSRDRRRNVWAS